MAFIQCVLSDENKANSALREATDHNHEGARDFQTGAMNPLTSLPLKGPGL